jgi:hypothetical protein
MRTSRKRKVLFVNLLVNMVGSSLVKIAIFAIIASYAQVVHRSPRFPKDSKDFKPSHTLMSPRFSRPLPLLYSQCRPGSHRKELIRGSPDDIGEQVSLVKEGARGNLGALA